MTTMMFNRTHLCADDQTDVRLRVNDGKVYLEFGGDEQHTLTISATLILEVVSGHTDARHSNFCTFRW